MNTLVRALVVVALITLVIMVLQLYATLFALTLIVQIAFPLAIAYFVFLAWRDRRSEIDLWSKREKWVFYGAAILIVVDLLLLSSLWILVGRPAGLDAVAAVLVLLFCGFSMFRVWRDTHTLGG
jgi:small-conductance mechanosensitive channel